MVLLNYCFGFIVQQKKKKKNLKKKEKKKKKKNYKTNTDFLCSGAVIYLSRNFI